MIRNSLKAIGQQRGVRVGLQFGGLREFGGGTGDDAAHGGFTSESVTAPSEPDVGTAELGGSRSRDPKDVLIKQDDEMTKGEIVKVKKKTQLELDEELRAKLEEMSGEGGAAGVEYEGGKAEGLKKGVKDNMFRVI